MVNLALAAPRSKGRTVIGLSLLVSFPYCLKDPVPIFSIKSFALDKIFAYEAESSCFAPFLDKGKLINPTLLSASRLWMVVLSNFSLSILGKAYCELSAYSPGPMMSSVCFRNAYANAGSIRLNSFGVCSWYRWTNFFNSFTHLILEIRMLKPIHCNELKGRFFHIQELTQFIFHQHMVELFGGWDEFRVLVALDLVSDKNGSTRCAPRRAPTKKHSFQKSRSKKYHSMHASWLVTYSNYTRNSAISLHWYRD